MQAPGKAPTVIAGFAPNQPHGPYEFTSQHVQGFPGYQMGSMLGSQMGQVGSHQMNPPMGSQMQPQMVPQMGSQMGLHMGSQMGPQMGSQMGPQMGLQVGPQMGSQMGPQMGSQMGSQNLRGSHVRPQMQMSPQADLGIQIGALPSNVQLGHQFPKQQQKLMEQQRKRAEEQRKKEEELMKKRQLEAEKRKLQKSFIDRKATNADALNSLFGKSNKATGSSMSNLLGSLGSDTNVKPSVNKPSSVFSRPGGSGAIQSDLPTGQWGSGYMTAHGNPAASSSKQIHEQVDDFGEFSQGPSVPDQGDFSQFQGAQPGHSQFGDGTSAVLPNVSGNSNTLLQPQSWHGAKHSLSGTQGTSVSMSSHGIQRPDQVPSSGASWPSSASWTGPSTIAAMSSAAQFPGETSRPQIDSSSMLPLQGSQLTPSAGDPSRPQVGSFSGLHFQGGQLAQTSGNIINLQTGQIGTSSQFAQIGQITRNTTTPRSSDIMGQGGQMPNMVGEAPKSRSGSTTDTMQNALSSAHGGQAMLPPVTSLHSSSMRTQDGGVSVPPPTVGPQGGGFGVLPSLSAVVPVSSQEHLNLQQGPETIAPLEPIQDPGAESNDSPEGKLEVLYGVKLPDWCVNGTDLPGVYKEIQEKTIGASETIDTNRLFPILMASDLSRDQLGHIWNRANRAIAGQLNTLELRMVLGLVALAQAGMKTERLTLEKLASCMAAPIPTIPEHVLQDKSCGWSFTEALDKGSEESRTEGDFMGDQFSDHSADPTDKYSVFRALQQPETHRAANMVAEDSKDTFGAFKTGDHPVSKPDLIPNQSPLPHVGLGHPSNSNSSQTEVNVMGRLNNPNLQRNFGNFQTAAVQGTSQELGTFQDQTVFSGISGQSSVEKNQSQDDFGDFQSQTTLPTLQEITISGSSKSFSQVKISEVQNLQTGDDLNGRASPAFKPSIGTSSVKDDFGDFQGGNEPTKIDQTSMVNNDIQAEGQGKLLKGFENFKIGVDLSTKVKSSGIADLGSFSKGAGNTVGNIDRKSQAGDDGFGDFQHNPGPLSSNTETFTSFGSNDSEKPVSSVEQVKLTNESWSQIGSKLSSKNEKDSSKTSLTTEADSSDTNEMFADFSKFQSVASTPSNQLKTSEDKYSAFKEFDFSSDELLSVPNPVTTTDNQALSDEFADFGGFEAAEEFKSADHNGGDVSAFQSTGNDQSFKVGMTHGSQQVQGEINQDFGDFNSFRSSSASTLQPENGFHSTEQFGSFLKESSTAANKSQANFTSHASDSLINAVSLEPTERYKVLSHESGDMDQHANAWSRCLNSCLLTLATATLAIQKIAEQSVKEEVLESKEGATYFSAIVEIYRVTLRIKASINKSAPNNKKLQDIQQEIDRTWKGISTFLSGSNILPSQSCMDFNLHHVTASEDGSMACGICLLNVNKMTTGASKTGDSKLMYGGRQYHSTCANFWCNRVDSVLPSLLPMDSLI
ncbi:synergin gamma-like isoform X2 [Acropora palmata]